MSEILPLGPVVLELPLTVDARAAHESYVDPPHDPSRLPVSHARLENEGHRELAYLFAASPDLLLAAALDSGGHYHNGGDDEGRVYGAKGALRLAIARARGGSHG